MNGIDAVAIATGQDWRAIEAAAHAWACRDGVYSPLAHYAVQGEHICYVMSWHVMWLCIVFTHRACACRCYVV